MDYYKLYFHNCTFTISSCGNTISNFQIVLPKLYFHYIFMLKYNFQILLPQLYFHNCTFIVKRNGFLDYFFLNCNDITMVDEKTNPILRVLARVSNIIVYECRQARVCNILLTRARTSNIGFVFSSPIVLSLQLRKKYIEIHQAYM